MSKDDKDLTIPAPADLAELSAVVDFPLDTLAVEWTQVRELIAPQGNVVAAKDLVGTHITIFRFHRFPSRFQEQKYAYWVVGRNDATGELFNTVLGGQAIVEALDKYIGLQVAYGRAREFDDQQAMEQMEKVGAGRALAITLDRKQGGQGQPYYVIADQ